MGKAVIFTLTFFLLGAVLLGMSFLIFDIAQSGETRAREIAINNRINDLSSSVSKSIADLFTSQSGIIVSATNNTISIQERVPNNNLQNYLSYIDDFKDFVESREAGVFINNAATGILTIMPENSIYSGQENASETRTISNFIGVIHANFSVSGNIAVENIEWREFTQGTTRISLTFQNSTTVLADSRDVNLAQDVRFRFLISAQLDQHIDFELEENLLEISNLRYNTTLTTSLAYAPEEHAAALINIPVVVRSPEFGITKTTNPRIM